MKKTVRWTVFLAALALMIGCFAGCGGNPAGDPASGTATNGAGSGTAGAADASGNVSEPDHTAQTDASGNSNASSGKTDNGNKTENSAGNDKTNNNKNSNNTNNNSNKTTVANSSGGAKDPLKEVETKGKTFTVISPFLQAKRTSNMDLYAELFLERAQEVEKELGCKINIVTTVKPTAEWLAPQIRSGKKVADLVHIEMRHLIPFITAGYIKAWSDVPGVNVKDSNFNQGVTKVSTIGGKTYGVSMLKPEEVRYCGIINKTLLKKYGIDPDEIYKKIDNGTWTFQALLDYALKIQKNSSFKGKAIDADPRYFIEILMGANNGRIVTIDNAGKATPTYMSANVREAAQFMYDLVYTHNLYDPKIWMSNEVAGPDQFTKGNVAFLFDEAWVVAKRIQTNVKNFDYGMIMVPKGPKASDYVSSLEHANMFVATSTNKELDFTAKVLNALTKPPKNQSGSQWWLEEAQLDLMQKGDTKSLEIYKRCLNSPAIDFGFCLPALTSAFKDAVLQNAIMDQKISVSAAFDSINGKLDGTINDVFKSISK